MLSSWIIAMSRLGLLCIMIEDFVICYSYIVPKIPFDHSLIAIVYVDLGSLIVVAIPIYEKITYLIGFEETAKVI